MRTLALLLLLGLTLGANAQKVSDLTAGSTTDSADLFMFVDVSDTTLAATGTNKKITWAELVAEIILDTAATYQPLDADLTTWAGITPSANVQALVGAADYAAMKVLLDLEIGTDVQAYDADLTTYAGITPTANVQTLLGSADYADFRAGLGVDIGADVQAYDADLTTYAGITPSADIQDFLGSVNYADMASRLGLTIGTDVQAHDDFLDDIGALTDPGADRIAFWDDSASAITWLTAGTGLTITDTTMTATAADFSAVAEDILPDADSTRDLGATGNRWAEIWADSFTTTDMTVTTLNATTFEFEGATADDFETTLTVTDPTADRTITLPDSTGTVALVAGDIGAATATTPSAGDSDTSVATTSFVTEGKIQKAFIEKHATSHTLTAAECYGGVYYVTAASTTLTLPAAADGMSLTVICNTANAVSVDSNASDLIILDGTALDDGDKITSGGTAGEIAVLTYYDATGWYAATDGWSDGGP